MEDFVLRERVAALDRLMWAEFASRDKAIAEVAKESERVRRQQNEWRGAMSDLAADKVDTRAWIERNKFVDTAFAAINEELAIHRGATRGVDKAWGYLVAGVAAVGTIIAIVMALTR